MELSFHFTNLRHAATQEVQLQEVFFYGRAGQRLFPISATNPNGDNPMRQGPENVLNHSRYKWLDLNFKKLAGSHLNLQFDHAVNDEISKHSWIPTEVSPQHSLQPLQV